MTSSNGWRPPTCCNAAPATPVALAAQDIEMVEYFYAHTIAPAIVSLAVPLSVLGFLAFYSWPVALALPLPGLCLAVAGARPPPHRRAGRPRPPALGEMSAHTPTPSRAWPT